MNTTINKNNETGLFEQTIFLQSNENDKSIKIIDFTVNQQSGRYYLILESVLFRNHPSSVSIDKNKLKIIIPDPVYIRYSNGLKKFGWNDNYSLSYFKLINFSVFLPGDNFYLVKNILIPEQYLLKVEMGWHEKSRDISKPA